MGDGCWEGEDFVLVDTGVDVETRNAVDYVSIGGNVQECSEVCVTEDYFERGPTLVVSGVRPIDAMIPTNARDSWNADCSSQMLNWGSVVPLSKEV